MSELEATLQLLQGNLKTERVLHRLHASLIGLPPAEPLPAEDEDEEEEEEDDPIHPSTSPVIDDGSTDPPSGPPPEDPVLVFTVLKGIVDNMEIEIEKLKRAQQPSNASPTPDPSSYR